MVIFCLARGNVLCSAALFCRHIFFFQCKEFTKGLQNGELLIMLIMMIIMYEPLHLLFVWVQFFVVKCVCPDLVYALYNIMFPHHCSWKFDTISLNWAFKKTTKATKDTNDIIEEKNNSDRNSFKELLLKQDLYPLEKRGQTLKAALSRSVNPW